MSRSGAFVEPSGPVFTVPFSTQVLTTGGDQDLWVLTAPSNSRVVVREIRLGQYSEFGDAQAELMSVRLLRGSTGTSTGASITPKNVSGHSGAPSAGTSVNGPSSGVASTASAEEIYADSFNVAAGWLYAPPVVERPVIAAGERLAVRLNEAQDAITINGTLTLQEIGAI